MGFFSFSSSHADFFRLILIIIAAYRGHAGLLGKSARSVRRGFLSRRLGSVIIERAKERGMLKDLFMQKA